MDLSADAERLFSVQRYSPRPQITVVEFVDLRQYSDEGGSMTELGRPAANCLMRAQNFTVAQINYVRVLDSLEPQIHPHGRPSCLRPKAELVVGDVRDPQQCTKAVDGIGAVVHAAAAVGVVRSLCKLKHYIDLTVRKRRSLSTGQRMATR